MAGLAVKGLANVRTNCIRQAGARVKMMWKWLTEIENGLFRTELCPLKIDHGEKEYSGQGFLSWNDKTGVLIEAFTDGGEGPLFDVLGGVMGEPGELLPPKSCMQLSADTRDGWKVHIERLPLAHFHTHGGHSAIVWRIPDSGIYSRIRFVRNVESHYSGHTTLLVGPLDLNCWPRDSKTTYENPHFRDERIEKDWLAFESDVASVVVQA